MYINIHSHSTQQLDKDLDDNNFEKRILSLCYFLDAHLLNKINDSSELFTIGVHPWALQHPQFKLSPLDLKNFNTIGMQENCVGIGEIGIDRAIKIESSYQTDLIKTVLTSINSQKELNKRPLIFHCVKAYNEFIYFFKENKDLITERKLIFHDYNGNVQITNELLKYNSYFSLGKNLFRENSKLVKNLLTIPIERILFETDEMEIPIAEVYKRYVQLTSRVNLKELKQQVLLTAEACLSHSFVSKG